MRGSRNFREVGGCCGRISKSVVRTSLEKQFGHPIASRGRPVPESIRKHIVTSDFQGGGGGGSGPLSSPMDPLVCCFYSRPTAKNYN